VQLKLIHPGSAGRGPLDEAARDYIERVRKRVKADELYLKPSRLPRPSDALAEEAERIRAAVGARDVVVALDRTGDAWSSEDVADHLGRWFEAAPPAVVFVLGSAHGLADGFVRSCRWRWSFGRLTLPHDLARVVLWEQLYRSFTIREGAPYHK
jgi:23S rRNA (pseudouridine1915-N3)-methyltransferase